MAGRSIKQEAMGQVDCRTKERLKSVGGRFAPDVWWFQGQPGSRAAEGLIKVDLETHHRFHQKISMRILCYRIRFHRAVEAWERPQTFARPARSSSSSLLQHACFSTYGWLFVATYFGPCSQAHLTDIELERWVLSCRFALRVPCEKRRWRKVNAD